MAVAITDRLPSDNEVKKDINTAFSLVLFFFLLGSHLKVQTTKRAGVRQLILSGKAAHSTCEM